MARGRQSLRIGAALALAALGGLALAGCSSEEIAPAPQIIREDADATVESAASFGKEYSESIERTETPAPLPLELTDAQSTQLTLEGKVDGVSDEDVKIFVDTAYANHPIGRLVYFPAETPQNERVSMLALLTASQLTGRDLGFTEDLEPGSLELSDADGVSQAKSKDSSTPPLIFVDGSWWIDGPQLRLWLDSTADGAPSGGLGFSPPQSSLLG